MLDVTDPPPYIRPAVNVTVAPGDKAILDCVVESNVEYDMRWYRVSAYSGEWSTTFYKRVYGSYIGKRGSSGRFKK